MTISQTELENRMHDAMRDVREHARFFESLLDATLYVLTPMYDDSPRVRLMMFRRPDGLHFVPCFTNEAQAEEAKGDGRIVSFAGRMLFEGSPGTTVVINPNHEHCTLYPEEIASLLATGNVPIIQQEVLTEDRDVLAGPPVDPPQSLMAELNTLYGALPPVISAHLLDVRDPKKPEEQTLVICLRVQPPHGDRVVHATMTRIQNKCGDVTVPIDITVQQPDEEDYLGRSGLLIYERDPTRCDAEEIAPGIPQRSR